VYALPAYLGALVVVVEEGCEWRMRKMRGERLPYFILPRLTNKAILLSWQMEEAGESLARQLACCFCPARHVALQHHLKSAVCTYALPKMLPSA
jgi:hypothetical protein